MEDREINSETSVGAMRKRRETMTDGKRYIIYYTFEETEKTPEVRNKEEVKENV